MSHFYLCCTRRARSIAMMTMLSVSWLLVLTDARANGEPAPSVAIVQEKSCFQFETYEAWMTFIRSKQADGGDHAVAAERFAAHFPKKAYDEYQRTLDCSFFTYTVDGVEVMGFSAQPKKAKLQAIPAVVYNRGGNGPAGRVTFAQILDEIFPLATRGYFVIGSQYRQNDEFGGKDVEDVLALLDIIDRRSDIAKDLIGMMGWSRGGIMTAMAATRSNRIKAIILGGTPADLFADLGVRPDMENVYTRRIPGYADNKEAVLRSRSPVFLVGKIPSAVPILILHGGADERTGPSNALRLALKLQELKRTYKLIVYPGGDHGLTRNQADVRKEVSDWFETYLVQPPGAAR